MENIGIAYDDPETTPAEEWRFDLGIAVPESFEINGNLIEKRLPAGQYLVSTHHGSRDDIAKTVYGLYEYCVSNDITPADQPCIFKFITKDTEVSDTEQVTECWLLIT